MAKELSEKEISQKVAGAGAKERVSALDPDFLLILTFAMIVDGIDVIIILLALLDAYTITGVISTVFDLFIMVMIGGWMYMRINRIAEGKKQQTATLRKTAEKKVAGMQKQLAQGIKSPMRRVLTRGGVALLGELIPLIGLIPFWTITVILTLREK